MSKRNSSGRSPIDADAVLSGRHQSSAIELLELIHRVNPTGRELAGREVELRYAQKARLQSLLVRRFQADLEVVSDADREGTVSLRLRAHGRDACHAVIATLDDDARAWVQLQVDLGGAETPTPRAATVGRPTTRRAGSADEPAAKADRLEGAAPRAEAVDALLRRAQQEIEAYDYAAAQEHLLRAVEGSAGAVAPVLALLEVLVDVLGDDAGALQLEASISSAALADARVRGALALAAARSGAEDRAIALLRGAEEVRAAPVLLALSASALGGGDVERAADHFERARRMDPAGAAASGLASEIAKARSAAREPEEVALAALLAAGRDAEAEKKADQVLARWPESEAARRALRAIEESRRRGEARRLASEAEFAVAGGAVTVGLAQLRGAIALARGADRDALERRLREIEGAEADRRDAERVERACNALGGADRAAGLLLYLELEEALRGQVRTRFPREELRTLDLASTSRAGDRAKVDAALALEQARVVADLDPAAALATLAPHAAVLDRVPEARRIARAAEATLRAQRLERARLEVRTAHAELEAGAAADAHSRLVGAVLRELPDDERAAAEALSAEAARVVARIRRGEEVARLRGAGRWFEARVIAEALAESADSGGRDRGGERARWTAERDAIRAEIQAGFRVEVDDEPWPVEDLGRLRPGPETHDAPCWLTADGRAVVLAWAHERWVVVRVLNLDTMEVRPTVRVRTPEPLGQVDVTVSGGTVWIVGGCGGVLEIGVEGWEVRDFRPAEDFVSSSDVADVICLAPDPRNGASRYLWVASRARGWKMADRIRVVDLDQRRVVREVPEGWGARPLAGHADGAVTVFEAGACTLYTPRGTPLPQGRLRPRIGLQSLAVHPVGAGYVGLVAADPSDPTEEPEVDDDVRSISIGVLSPVGKLGRSVELEGTDADRRSCLVTSRRTGLAFACADARHLFAFDASGVDLVPLWDVELAMDTMLVQDFGAGTVVALAIHDSGAEAVELGREPPELPSRPQHERVELPDRFDVISCDKPSGERNAAALALSASTRGKSDAEVARWVHERETAAAATPEELVEVLFALRAPYTPARSDMAKRLADRLAARFPDHAEMRLLRASALAVDDRWSDAGEALVGVQAADLDETQAQHLHHLRAMVALREGRFDDLAPHVEAALALEGRCNLEPLAELARLQTSAGDDAGSSPAALGELVRTVGAADVCFARGDAAGAATALDGPVVWAAREVQSLARLAEAYLHIEPATRLDSLRKLAALGAFLDEHEAPNRERRELPPPGAWDRARIDAIAARAHAWLDAQGAPR